MILKAHCHTLANFLSGKLTPKMNTILCDALVVNLRRFHPSQNEDMFIRIFKTWGTLKKENSTMW